MSPATAKLGKFGTALQQLRDQLTGKREWNTPDGLSSSTAAGLSPVNPPSAKPASKAPSPDAKPQASPPVEPFTEAIGQPIPAPDPIARRKSVAKRLRELLRTTSFRVEQRPTEISAETSSAVHAALERGAQVVSRRPEPDMRGFIVGLDLGTSSVKCAYRQPYTAGDPVTALSVPPELRSFGHPYLWQTVVWFDAGSQRFSLVPIEGSVPLDGFKSGLILDAGRAWAAEGVHVTKAEAMTAFMAMMIAFLLGNYDLKRPLGFKAGDHFLSINIGIPVAACDDQATFDTYAKMLAAAHDLASIATELTLKDVRTTYCNARAEKPTGFELVPELSAAIAAYVSDPTAPDGAHILVDVGASTLDIVAFNLINRAQVSVFTACVELLGAAALEQARAAGIDEGDFKRACDDAFECVYGGARHQQRAPMLFHPARRKRYVQLVKTGGGCRTPVHEIFIAEMNRPAVLGDVQAIDPVPPASIANAECDKSRLLLAYGLTRDLPELLALRLPSQISDLPAPTEGGPRPITKDDV